MTTKPQSDPLGSSRLMFWQPIETAPKDGTEILAAVRYPMRGCYESIFICWITTLKDYPEGVWGSDYEWPIICGTPTYWMPVPRYVEPTEESKEPPQPGTITLSGPGAKRWEEIYSMTIR